MAILKNPYLLVNSVDLSAYVKSIDLTPDVAKVDKTVGNSGGMKSTEAGLEQMTIKVKFLQAFGAGLVHATLLAAHKLSVAVEYRTTTSAVSASNPKITGNFLVLYTSPGGGAIGNALEAEAELTSDGAYTWATA